MVFRHCFAVLPHARSIAAVGCTLAVEKQLSHQSMSSNSLRPVRVPQLSMAAVDRSDVVSLQHEIYIYIYIWGKKGRKEEREAW